jgi:ubiquinone/menaquinone biosynthesis C-methylase UbiE
VAVELVKQRIQETTDLSLWRQGKMIDRLDVTRKNQLAYDEIAPVYAQGKNAVMAENLLLLAQKLVAQSRPGSHLIEVGCGVGRDMAWFEEQGIRVTGIDLSGGMLAIARGRVRGGLNLMDMRQLAFVDQQFDCAWCCASLLHLPKTEAPRALLEMRRVLKPASMMILSIQAGEGEGWDGGYVEGVKRFFARYSAQEMAQLLAASGFVTQEIQEAQAGKRQWLGFVTQVV